MKPRTPPIVPLLLALLLGCGSTTTITSSPDLKKPGGFNVDTTGGATDEDTEGTPPEEDVAIEDAGTPDAGLSDAVDGGQPADVAPDVPPDLGKDLSSEYPKSLYPQSIASPGNPGGPCASCMSTSTCASPFECAPSGAEHPDGECLLPCLGVICPEGGTCVEGTCRFACKSDSECRVGYRCHTPASGEAFCVGFLAHPAVSPASGVTCANKVPGTSPKVGPFTASEDIAAVSSKPLVVNERIAAIAGPGDKTVVAFVEAGPTPSLRVLRFGDFGAALSPEGIEVPSPLQKGAEQRAPTLATDGAEVWAAWTEQLDSKPRRIRVARLDAASLSMVSLSPDPVPAASSVPPMGDQSEPLLACVPGGQCALAWLERGECSKGTAVRLLTVGVDSLGEETNDLALPAATRTSLSALYDAPGQLVIGYAFHTKNADTFDPTTPSVTGRAVAFVNPSVAGGSPQEAIVRPSGVLPAGALTVRVSAGPLLDVFLVGGPQPGSAQLWAATWKDDGQLFEAAKQVGTGPACASRGSPAFAMFNKVPVLGWWDARYGGGEGYVFLAASKTGGQSFASEVSTSAGAPATFSPASGWDGLALVPTATGLAAIHRRDVPGASPPSVLAVEFAPIGKWP